MTVRVSVVIPTYNSTPFIRETLHSVFEQTLLPHEIIVVDDASTDGTPEIVSELARSAPVPVRLLRLKQNSGGPSRPLNRGIAVARSDVIATLDHDDLMVPTRLERQTRCLKRGRDLGLVIGWWETISLAGEVDRADHPSREWVDSTPRQSLGESCFRFAARDAYSALVMYNAYALTCSTFLFPRSIWLRCGGFDESLRTALDFAFHQRVVREYDLGLVDASIVRYRLHSDSLYQASSCHSRAKQDLEIYKRFDRTLLTPLARQVLQHKIRAEALAAAFQSREEGDYHRALGHYLTSLRWGGWNREGALGLVKLVPHKVRRWLRRACPPWDKGGLPFRPRWSERIARSTEEVQ